MNSGNLLKKWRVDRGISQGELAKRLGASQALVSHYERYGLPSSVKSLRRISVATGISLDDLMRGIR